MCPCKSSSVVCLASDAVCKWDATLCRFAIGLQTMIRLLSLQPKETSSLGSILEGKMYLFNIKVTNL